MCLKVRNGVLDAIHVKLGSIIQDRYSLAVYHDITILEPEIHIFGILADSNSTVVGSLNTVRKLICKGLCRRFHSWVITHNLESLAGYSFRYQTTFPCPLDNRHGWLYEIYHSCCTVHALSFHARISVTYPPITIGSDFRSETIISILAICSFSLYSCILSCNVPIAVSLDFRSIAGCSRITLGTCLSGSDL